MKTRAIAFIFAISLISTSFISLANANKSGGKIASVGATVTGYIDLITLSNRNVPEDLEDILKGHGSQITLGKKGKRINVHGTYEAGESVVRVEEDGITDTSLPQYLFDIPVPKKISSSRSGKFVINNTIATLYYSSKDDLDRQGMGDDGGNNSVSRIFKKKFVKNKKPKSPIKQFKGKLKKLAIKRYLRTYLTSKTSSVSDFGAIVSVSKVTGVRKGNTGTISGTFSRSGSPAKGRFKLTLKFES